MVLNNGLGRPRIVTKFKSAYEYLNKYVFVIKDGFFILKDKERIKEREYQAAKNKRMLQEQKLEKAYEGFEVFRK